MDSHEYNDDIIYYNEYENNLSTFITILLAYYELLGLKVSDKKVSTDKVEFLEIELETIHIWIIVQHWCSTLL